MVLSNSPKCLAYCLFGERWALECYAGPSKRDMPVTGRAIERKGLLIDSFCRPGESWIRRGGGVLVVCPLAHTDTSCFHHVSCGLRLVLGGVKLRREGAEKNDCKNKTNSMKKKVGQSVMPGYLSRHHEASLVPDALAKQNV